MISAGILLPESDTYVLSFAFFKFSRNFSPTSVVVSGVSGGASGAPCREVKSG